ncbi:MAG TPA: hypothetical protein ENK96_00345 [Desulfobulbaceae bacterium]|nr:hypothetical protein [Desulfobulbaceae bacterium]
MKRIHFLTLVLVLLQAPLAVAALEFNPTLSLTAGFPGDLPDNTRVAYNSRHREYLVVYQYHNSILPGPDQIHAARLSADGKYIANYIISDLLNSCGQPDVAYDPLFDRYLVVWAYDTANDGTDHGWDIYGRFIPWSGPTDTLNSFEIAAGYDEYTGSGFHLAVAEKNPRIAYGKKNKTFLIVMEAVPIDPGSKPYITGTKVSVTGNNHWQNLTIRLTDISLVTLAHPDVAYDSLQDEFLVVFDDNENSSSGGSIFGQFVTGQEAVGEHHTLHNFGIRFSEINPGIALSGHHERPAVDYCPAADFYLITWVTNRDIGLGDLWARYYPGRSVQPPPSAVHLEQLDTGDSVNLVDVACGANKIPTNGPQGGADCLVTWTLRHDNAFWTFGRQISLVGDSNGNLLSHATGFFGPLQNLGAESSWGTGEPRIGVASGPKNFCPAFTGLDSLSNQRTFSRMSSYSPLPGWSAVTADADSFHGLATRRDGSLYAWGSNYYGVLGLGDTKDRNTPEQVGSAKDWVMVSTGQGHTLGIRSDGSLWAWGYNYYGQLGLGDNGDNTDRITPVRVGSATDWITVSAGGDSSFGIRSDGSLWAWGDNLFGGLGLGDTNDRSVPTRVGTWNDWVAVNEGRWFTLGIRADGSLYAWGSNFVGQLGLGDFNDRTAPARVGTWNDWVTVSAGDDHSLGIRADGSLYAWGMGGSKLGLGPHDPHASSLITKVGSFTDWLTVSAGFGHSLGIRADGSLWAWGDNQSGELGLGDNAERNTPARVGTWAWQTMAAGDFYSFAIRSDGSLWSWGYNHGTLGLGDTTDRNIPTQVFLPKSKFPWAMFLPAIINGKTN